ncbi:hypothetical protein [Vibrio aestuarianus]|uniref:PRD domain-containing protein n=1 Tax=Vibrio aestuarianus TaxID=28171 RepID=A0A9X4EYD8_9VIBR|nr:hypothetical protein [Vibrio aestuarianus]MDE1242598.1 hypothetical protein [Vibrio aestuarianus]
MTILLNGGVISQVAHDAALNASQLLASEWNVDLHSEQLQMAMTHFARATDRIINNDPIKEGLDSDIFEEISSDCLFTEIESMNKKICAFTNIELIPEEENSFLLSNLYAIKINL